MGRPECLAVVGLGAIGGSVAWQARRAGVPRVVAYAAEPSDGAQAVTSGAITELVDSARRAVRDATVVVLATPPAATLALLGELAGAFRPDAIVTDVASVKAAIVQRAADVGLGDRFAGAHPLAGTHGSGFAYAQPDRLRGAIVYVCDAGGPAGDKVARAVSGFWSDVLEAAPIRIDAAVHDRQLAWTSHLPQAVASSLASALAAEGLTGVSYGPGGRDTTRLAASAANLWVDIFLQNGVPVVEALERTEGELAKLRSLIAGKDAAGLRAFLERAAAFRRGLDR